MSDNVYRLNCNLPEEIGNKIAEVAEKKGMTKVGVITLALNQFFETFEVQEKYLEEVKKNPALLNNLMLALGKQEESR